LVGSKEVQELSKLKSLVLVLTIHLALLALCPTGTEKKGTYVKA